MRNGDYSQPWNVATIPSRRCPTDQFQGGKLSVFGGINRITGSYALLGNQSLVLGELASTRMAGSPELGEIESEFSSALASVDAFHVEGKRLDLLKGTEVVAVFSSDEPQ